MKNSKSSNNSSSNNSSVSIDYDRKNDRLRCRYGAEKVVIDGELHTEYKIYCRVAGIRYSLIGKIENKEKAYGLFMKITEAGKVCLKNWGLAPTMSEIRHFQGYFPIADQIMAVKLPEIEVAHRNNENNEGDIAF